MSFRAQRGIPLRLKSQEKEGFPTPQTPFGMTDTEFFSSLLGISCAPNPLSFLYAHSRCVFAARMKRKAVASRRSPESRQLTANSSEKNIGGGHEPPLFVFRNHQQTIEGTLRPMPDKKHILNSIAAVAKHLGRAPSRAEFISRSGISLHFVLQSFPSWSQAIQAAGLRPYTLNVRVEDRALLEDWGKTARRNRAILRNRARLPRHIYRRQGKYNPCTLAKRFGGWECVPRAFRHFAKGKRA